MCGQCITFSSSEGNRVKDGNKRSTGWFGECYITIFVITYFFIYLDIGKTFLAFVCHQSYKRSKLRGNNIFYVWKTGLVPKQNFANNFAWPTKARGNYPKGKVMYMYYLSNLSNYIIFTHARAWEKLNFIHIPQASSSKQTLPTGIVQNTVFQS